LINRPYRVLVVDDLVQNLVVAEALLESLGCQVVTARNGQECIDLVAAGAPDLILLDVMMPVMDGLAVCRVLKRDPEHRHIPIVLLTSLDSTEDYVAGIEAGADDFVVKPFRRHELLARVKSLLRVKRLVEGERQHLRGTLERYVGASVAQKLLDQGQFAAPSGNRVDASILFADIRSFSAWSELTEPEAVVEVMNAFLGAAVEIVFRFGGAVDKFTGDGLMAIFGAPVPTPDHPRRAVRASLDIAALAGVGASALPAPLLVGCGVNSGEMVIGSIGSERRLDYTAMGDAVNLARRLCDEAAGGQVLVAEATRVRLVGVHVEDLGRLRVKNRQEPIQTYSVVSLADTDGQSSLRGAERAPRASPAAVAHGSKIILVA
jgi:class 3 adenylate cyclase